LSIAISVAHDGIFSYLRAFMVGDLEEIFPIILQLTNEVENASFRYIHKSDSLIFSTKLSEPSIVIPASAVGEAGSSTQWGVLNDLLKDESHF
jgi:hypothetical protein